MFKIKYWLLICTVFSPSVYCNETQSAIQDYAKGIELITEQAAAIYKLVLPEEIYSVATQKDLSDIRVFNNKNEPVPHVIRREKNKTKLINTTLALPFFPLPAEKSGNVKDILDITVSNEGKVIRIQSEDIVSKSEQTNAKQYLIDASQIDRSIDSLDFYLTETAAGYAKTIKLEYSHDLNNWVNLVNRTTLTELKYGNYTLKNTRVELPNRKIKYLRFTWLDDANELAILSIKANLSNQYLSDNKYWTTARTTNKNIENAIYEFDTGGVFNVEQINIELPEDNTLIEAVIESRPDSESEWRWRFNGVFYKLYYQGAEITGKPVNVSTNTDRYWRIKLQSTDGIGQAKPVLKYAWRSNELYFLARGEGPFVLAFGNANVTQVTRPASRLMNVMKGGFKNEMINVAKPGREIIFSGEAALSAQDKLPWQRIILWAVLVGGVIVIGTMVLRLSKQMKEIP